MKKLLSPKILLASGAAVIASASQSVAGFSAPLPTPSVPEVSAVGAVSALTVAFGITALVFERRRKKRSK